MKRISPQTWLLSLCLLAITALGWSCSTQPPQPPAPWQNPTPDSNGIPNLSLVEPGVWRGGQPDVYGFAWLKAGGFTIIKLNESAEGSDLPAQDMGIPLYYEPIGTIEQLIDGPSPKTIATVESLLHTAKRPVFIHCEHGQDRTGLAVGLYRLSEGTNKAAAYQEMLDHGFHPALHGIHEYWENQPDTTR